MGQENSQLQPGDLIEVDRPFHQHWALYIGGGYVINLTPVGRKDVQLGVHTVAAFIRKVKKQRLKVVVRNNKWRVNNKYDDSYSPLPVEEIIRRAEICNDRVLNYRGFGSNCENFVKKLRYGDPLRASVGSELQNLDMTENKDCPKPGDLIEIQRGPYKQWALYVGDGYVIHVTPLDENGPPLSANSKSTFIRKARVTKELLKVGVNDD
ncbi:phospholipase A and acyltransferase 1-like isoform X1 [Serinus canaria]|uniref:phospholipase A and acyltransferase 1-like isoform X1 n=1 Tax=Serinus canaria TaxID=9135 RepID=UPI0021CC9D0C|nr:phospholipase A and acyltransferase 1-like isoform X1 [Serinus canaria]